MATGLARMGDRMNTKREQKSVIEMMGFIQRREKEACRLGACFIEIEACQDCDLDRYPWSVEPGLNRQPRAQQGTEAVVNASMVRGRPHTLLVGQLIITRTRHINKIYHRDVCCRLSITLFTILPGWSSKRFFAVRQRDPMVSVNDKSGSALNSLSSSRSSKRVNRLNHVQTNGVLTLSRTPFQYLPLYRIERLVF